MEDGLNVEYDKFKDLKRSSQNEVIFLNVAHIRKQLDKQKFHKKFQYAWLSFLTAIVLSIFGLKKF